jgi:pimeloyl-ACP methyl ester carboxylesterase
MTSNASLNLNLKMTPKVAGFFEAQDKTPIYYEVRGEGEPVVFIYGIACLMNHWHHQLDTFSACYKTVTYDLRGHHKSTPVRNLEHLTLQDLASDLVGLMDFLKLEGVHVVAHSFGVPIALEAYIKKPTLFKSLCFINGFAKNPIQNMFGVDIVAPFYRFAKTSYAQNPVLWESLWRRLIDNPVSMRLAALAGGFNLKLTHFKDIEVYARGVAQMELSVFLPLFDQLMAFDGEPFLSQIKIPTLIVSGENDNITPKSFQKLFVDQIPGAELLIVPYGSHCTQLDFPEYVNLRLQSFWGGL